MVIDFRLVAKLLAPALFLFGIVAFIWKNLDESESKEALVDKIMDEFEVDEETARIDVEGFVGALYEHGLVLVWESQPSKLWRGRLMVTCCFSPAFKVMRLKAFKVLIGPSVSSILRM